MWITVVVATFALLTCSTPVASISSTTTDAVNNENNDSTHSRETEIFLAYVMPSIGIFISLIVFMTPFREIKQLAKDKDLGTLNPYPYPIMMGAQACGLTYGLVLKDYFFFFSNYPGTILCTWYTLQCLSCNMANKTRDIMQKILMVTVLILTVEVLVLFVSIPDEGKDDNDDDDDGKDDVRVTIAGTLFVIYLAVMYYSPASTVMHIIKTKDASSILPPLQLAVTTNAVIWLTYGLFIEQPYIWGPNVVGLVIGVLLFVLYFIYPSNKRKERKLRSKLKHEENTDIYKGDTNGTNVTTV
eukprot:m.282472 g.282472  ORF g.282472 m.282472 type:complete len:300 (+) comp16337_c0_seq63:1597-2496(+)